MIGICARTWRDLWSCVLAEILKGSTGGLGNRRSSQRDRIIFLLQANVQNGSPNHDPILSHGAPIGAAILYGAGAMDCVRRIQPSISHQNPPRLYPIPAFWRGISQTDGRDLHSQPSSLGGMQSAPRPSWDIVWVKVSGHSDSLDTVNVYLHAGLHAPDRFHQLQSATGTFPSRTFMAGDFNLRSRLWEPGASKTAGAQLSHIRRRIKTSLCAIHLKSLLTTDVTR
ncbi:hypothetical protein K470DRAFT_263963 [Piedraia hortae CBS 480.64]|uniref:Endonuclease/exonuclease/phosphatase domain-containing protein n=1 Tax=Piedraia hortae CBS 480.64 TaxID=1314780 RepID=A0A6A7C294_9PEZI|nr:hypothetical protein K470DRAFT_263963 [Piedraia hortae CBS 480.64]